MSVFIDDLKHEHQELLSYLSAFKKGQGIIGSEWKESLFAAKSLFIQHLKKEDSKLYPELLKESEKDAALKAKIEKFAQEMRSISMKAMNFFDKYSSVSGGTEFIQDFAELEILLKSRIAEEEKNLFSEYEKRF